MRQFDVVENPSSQARRYAPYLVVLQSHYLEGVESVILAPLVRDSLRPILPLDIPVTFADESLVIAMAELASVPRAVTIRRAGTVGEHEEAIRRAIDRLFTGF